jgi:hypothetical protein
MRLSPTALRASRILPWIALLVGVLFLTGQTLNCCHVNESIAKSFKHLFSRVSGPHLHSEGDISADAHAHCHGHGTGVHGHGSPSLAKSDVSDCDYSQDGACLSEKSFAGKPMLASDAAVQSPVVPMMAVMIEIPETPEPIFERPRPQNKSSPPLYLTTLRILV